MKTIKVLFASFALFVLFLTSSNASTPDSQLKPEKNDIIVAFKFSRTWTGGGPCGWEWSNISEQYILVGYAGSEPLYEYQRSASCGGEGMNTCPATIYAGAGGTPDYSNIQTNEVPIIESITSTILTAINNGTNSGSDHQTYSVVDNSGATKYFRYDWNWLTFEDGSHKFELSRTDVTELY